MVSQILRGSSSMPSVAYYIQSKSCKICQNQDCLIEDRLAYGFAAIFVSGSLAYLRVFA